MATSRKFQSFPIVIDASGSTPEKKLQIEGRYKKVTGIYASQLRRVDTNATIDSKATCISLEIDGNEILPEDFELGLIQPTTGVSVSDLPLQISEEASGKVLKYRVTNTEFLEQYPAKFYLSVVYDDETGE